MFVVLSSFCTLQELPFNLLLQEKKGHDYHKLEKHASNMLIAGPALWMLGSIHNSCQIYERADAHVQILQQSVHIPFLIGSLLFFVAAVLNSYEQVGLAHHGLKLLVCDIEYIHFTVSSEQLILNCL